MSLQSDYDDILESKVCPNCGYVGMDSDGSFGYVCPNCDFESITINDEDEEDE